MDVWTYVYEDSRGWTVDPRPGMQQGNFWLNNEKPGRWNCLHRPGFSIRGYVLCVEYYFTVNLTEFRAGTPTVPPSGIIL